jgi:hypothetical protein
MCYIERRQDRTLDHDITHQELSMSRSPSPRFWRVARGLAAGSLLLALTLLGPLVATAQIDIGDTLTIIQRPLQNLPALVTPGSTLPIDCAADPATTGWAATLRHGSVTVPLVVTGASYDASTLWWRLTATVPSVPLYELYDLEVSANGGLLDTTRHAVRVMQDFQDTWYFVHITDTHLPTTLYYYENGADTDSTSMEDLRAVIEDINLINPEFVLLTGDLIHEGELEDYLGKRYFTRAQHLLSELTVPFYLVAGNHDIGGWDSTPPPDGTARFNWWKFFGWPRLDDPPPGAPWRTQNYSFDYGPIHFTGLEAYINYDDYLYWYYGSDSFTAAQLQWLDDDLAAAGGSTKVLFYHYDFSSQVDLDALGASMALWGHIHSDNGSLSQPPYNLATNNVCDGDRAFRLIRVSGSNLSPRPTLAAGATGSVLRVTYAPANDGTNETVTAQVINGHSERFQNGLLRVLMPHAAAYRVTGGTLEQVDASGPATVCYVDVDVPAVSSRTVTVEVDLTDVPLGRPVPASVQLAPARPNPFNPLTELRYGLARTAAVRLAIFDLQGREVAVLVQGTRDEGAHTVRWDGRDDRGQDAPSGIYLARLEALGQVRVQKLVLAR